MRTRRWFLSKSLRRQFLAARVRETFQHVGRSRGPRYLARRLVQRLFALLFGRLGRAYRAFRECAARFDALVRDGGFPRAGVAELAVRAVAGLSAIDQVSILLPRQIDRQT